MAEGVDENSVAAEGVDATGASSRLPAIHQVMWGALKNHTLIPWAFNIMVPLPDSSQRPGETVKMERDKDTERESWREKNTHRNEKYQREEGMHGEREREICREEREKERKRHTEKK